MHLLWRMMEQAHLLRLHLLRAQLLLAQSLQWTMKCNTIRNVHLPPLPHTHTPAIEPFVACTFWVVLPQWGNCFNMHCGTIPNCCCYSVFQGPCGQVARSRLLPVVVAVLIAAFNASDFVVDLPACDDPFQDRIWNETSKQVYRKTCKAKSKGHEVLSQLQCQCP